MLRKKSAFILLFALITSAFLITGSFAQEQFLAADNQEEPQPAAPASPKNIAAIEVQGNKSISSNTIISKLKSKTGSAYQENIINEDLKRLYALEYFSDIKIDTEDYKDGVKVIITVVERPIIESITFSGKGHLMTQDDKLKQSLKSKEGQYLDYPSLSEDIDTLKKMYEKMGYSQAEINYKADIDKETNKAKVGFDIAEGRRIRIKEIVFSGNTTFSSGKLSRLIKTRKAWLFNAGVLKEDVLKEDIERIKAFYSRNGFSDAEADYEVKPDPKKPFLYIMLQIREGRKYLVGTVTVTGNKDITEKDILDKIKETVPDKVFSHEAVKKDVSNIQGVYFDKGYISAQVEPLTSVDQVTGRVNVAYKIAENDITYVDKIKVRGNVKTKDLVIRRELKIKPGDRFDGGKLKRSKERLQNLGFFEEVSYDTEDTDESNKKDLIVDVKETKTGSFSFGGGYSTIDQFVGFVEIEQKNFDWRNFPYFTGAGQDLKFRASFGSISDGFDLSFTDPWVFDYPISFGFDAYSRRHDRDTDVGYGYNEKITGGDLRLGKEFSEYIRGDWAYRYENIDISDVSSDASSDLKDEVGKNNVSSMDFGLGFDSRDNVFDTLNGDLFTASYLLAGGPFGGDKDFWKFFARASHYFPLWHNSMLEFRLRAGFADAYDNTIKVPIYERFFCGGADTVRGYRERKLGPVDSSSNDPLGGDSIFIGNIEYTYPVFDFLKAALFYDTGNAWSKVGGIDLGDLKSGFGVGVRLRTPIGPIRVDYGIPFDKEPGEERKRSGEFHFSVSQGF